MEKKVFPEKIIGQLNDIMHSKAYSDDDSELIIIQYSKHARKQGVINVPDIPYEGVFISGSRVAKLDSKQDIRLIDSKNAVSIPLNAVKIFSSTCDGKKIAYVFSDSEYDSLFAYRENGRAVKLLGQSVYLNDYLLLRADDTFLILIRN